MGDERIVIDIGGPVTRQAVRSWIDAVLRGDRRPDLVGVRSSTPSTPGCDARELARALANDGDRCGARVGVEGRELVIAGVRVPVISPDDDWPAHDRVVGEPNSSELPGHIVATTAVVAALARALELRWTLIDVDAAVDAPALASRLLDTESSWAGKLSVRASGRSATVAGVCITATISGSADLEGVLDLLAANDPSSGSPALRIVPTPVHDGELASRSDVWIDVGRCNAVGPLLRIVAAYDPLAIRAMRLLFRGESP